jgi:hypothetical protein
VNLTWHRLSIAWIVGGCSIFANPDDWSTLQYLLRALVVAAVTFLVLSCYAMGFQRNTSDGSPKSTESAAETNR